MAMERPTTSTNSVVSEFEGTLLKNADLFSYFVLLAYEASGIIHSTILLFLYPIITLLNVFGYKNTALKLMIFVATAGLREPKIELVARAVLPKFYMDDVNMDTWRVFSSRKKKVVVTRMPRVMVERFAKEHLGADEVIGTELIVNGFGFVTGLVRGTDIDQALLNRVADLFVDRRPQLGLARPSTTFLSLCEEQIIAPVHWNHCDQQLEVQPPKPVIFHDGRFLKRPTPATSLLMLLWFPFGFILAAIRMSLFWVLPFWVIPYISGILGIRVIVKGKPPQAPVAKNSGVIFVANHRTIMDAWILSSALERKIPSIAYSGLPWSPTPLVWISRTRDTDIEIIKQALSKRDLMIFPEGSTCREPFLLRFSALFAELTDEIVPVAIKVSAGFFSACARGWNGLDLYSWLMNPTIVFEVTFLDQLLVEDTCSSGKTPYDVANHVQRILADTLGFQCTNLTRKDKYKLLT